jgi:hypothetical protein
MEIRSFPREAAPKGRPKAECHLERRSRGGTAPEIAASLHHKENKWLSTESIQKGKSALTFQLGRLGSPPPELPNHNWIVDFPQLSVNVTLVTGKIAQS